MERRPNRFFEQFSPRVRTIFILAQQEATRFGHSHLKREHLLLGMIKEGKSPAVEMLKKDMGVDLEALKTDIEKTLIPEVPVDKAIPIVGYDVVTVFRNSVSNGEPHIGSERLLMSLAGTDTGSLGEVLKKHNINATRASEAFRTWRIRTQAARVYEEKVTAAHEAFREKKPQELATSLFGQGEIAAKLFEIEGTDKWDLRTYGAYNAAGGAFEAIGDSVMACTSYKLALTSCERVAAGRSAEWKKNINHLKFLIERTTEQK